MAAQLFRTDLGGLPAHRPGTSLVRLLHLSDLHVLDTASPARCEWVETLADDPRWHPLLHMHRPYEALAIHSLAAMVAAIRSDPLAPAAQPDATRRPYDIALLTGDLVDNAQHNELTAYLAIVAGGRAHLPYAGPQQREWAAAFAGGPSPFWCPDEDVEDDWKRGEVLPAVPGLSEQLGRPITSAGISIPWAAVIGNHDVMRQGTAFTTPALERIAVGATKSMHRPLGFDPRSPIEEFLRAPEQFSCGHGVSVVPSAQRAVIDTESFIRAHIDAGALGFDETHERDRVADYLIDFDDVRVIALDTNHPDGDFQGSVGVAQLEWLDARLAEVDCVAGRIAVIATHHGSVSLTNKRGASAERVHGVAIEAVLHRHPCVVVWLSGHRHVHRVRPRNGESGGFWEISTGSLIDWPVQGRAIEVVRHSDGSHEVISTLLDPGIGPVFDPDGLAALHRDLARRAYGPDVARRRSGSPLDGSVRLVVPASPLSARRKQ